jgi:Putative MetA-pathway of phenol degradation
MRKVAGAAGAIAAAVTAAMLLAAPAAAQNVPPLVTDRPDQTESPVVVPRGMVQFEAGGLHEVANAGAGRVTSVASLLARAGLFGRVELRLGFLGWQRATASGADARAGFGDLSVGMKVALRDGDGLDPAAAVLASALVPVGDPDFRAAGVDPELRVALAHDLGGAFSLGYNVGAAWVTTESGAGTETRHVEGLYTLTVGRSFGTRLGAFVEAFGNVAPSNANPSSHGVDGGLTFGVRPNVQLDAAAGFGLDDAGPAWFLGMGVAVRIPR